MERSLCISLIFTVSKDKSEDKYWQVGDLGLRQNTESHIIRKYIIEENENLYPKLTRKMVNQDI